MQLGHSHRTIVIRWLTIPLAALFAVSVMGCGGGEEKPAGSSSSSTTPKKVSSNSDKTGGNSETEDPANGGVPAGKGSLTGVITFNGDVPELKSLVTKGDEAAKDAAICAAETVPDESLVVNSENKGVANVFVYLSKAPKGADDEAPTDPVVFDQKSCQFIPHALVARVGQTVLVKSGDDCQHNVHTFPVSNNTLNQIVQANDRKGLELVYELAERKPLQVKCDIHPWMSAWHLPLDHGFVAITDADGKFEIPNIPAGKHKLQIWHEKADFLERGYEVTIEVDKPQNLELKYGSDKFVASNPADKTITISASR